MANHNEIMVNTPPEPILMHEVSCQVSTKDVVFVVIGQWLRDIFPKTLWLYRANYEHLPFLKLHKIVQKNGLIALTYGYYEYPRRSEDKRAKYGKNDRTTGS